MSNFWHWYIVVLVVGNIAALVWLARWSQKPSATHTTVPGDDTTGHVWDIDLAEYNNPLPRWWVGLFYLGIIVAVIYLIFYPGLGKFPGLLGWTSTRQYHEEMEQANARYAPIYEKYMAMAIPDLANDPEARKIGQRLFLNYCSSCHASDARGAKGFPNLTDAEWLWGGAPERIEETILKGRSSAMPAWGPALGSKGVEEVANYVLTLSGRKADPELAKAGEKTFKTNCFACHGPDGKGNQMLGAPDLTNASWLWGGDIETIKETITHGRTNRMPSHEEFLGKEKVHLLAGYVYSVSHKEAQ